MHQGENEITIILCVGWYRCLVYWKWLVLLVTVSINKMSESTATCILQLTTNGQLYFQWADRNGRLVIVERLTNLRTLWRLLIRDVSPNCLIWETGNYYRIRNATRNYNVYVTHVICAWMFKVASLVNSLVTAFEYKPLCDYGAELNRHWTVSYVLLLKRLHLYLILRNMVLRRCQNYLTKQINPGTCLRNNCSTILLHTHFILLLVEAHILNKWKLNTIKLLWLFKWIRMKNGDIKKILVLM
jgi:hypothetical protein